MLNSIGTLPGPCTGTSSPAARTVRGPATKGTATEIPEILRKSRRETRELSGLSSEIFRFGSSSRIRYLQITESFFCQACSRLLHLSWLRKNAMHLAQRLKPSSQQAAERSPHALRHPKSDFRHNVAL